MNELRDVDVDKYVVHVDTGVMLPITLPYVEEVCRRYNWNLTVLKSNFFEYAEKWGMPTMHRRWCCYQCKLKPIAEFTSKLTPPKAEAVGLRWDESWMRRKLPQIYLDDKRKVWKYAPIIHWKDEDVMKYIKEHDLPIPPHYKLGIKETCQCGAFSNEGQMMILKANFPELFKKFVELEGKFRKGGAAFYFKNKPTYAKDLLKQKTLDETLKH
jgi:3'-phosphoadenosine 5'-phosphosulfate sulfotransferase (PAPS reductase)/FAD synthetase